MSGQAATTAPDVLARFRSGANINRMVGAMTAYCQDRMNVSIAKVLGEATVYEAVAAATHAPQPPAADVDAMNKYMAVRLRERFQAMLRDQAGAGPAPAAEADPDDFYFRLQDIETTRQRVHDISVDAGAAASATGEAPGPAALPPNIATVFIPTPSKRGQTLCIRSFARPWHAATPRSTLAWAGPLPPFIDATNVRVAALQLPFFVAQQTPYVRIVIDGVGGATTECVVMPRDVAPGARWTMWEAACESLSYIIPVPCPWSIRLLDANGQLLDMGMDGMSMVKKETAAASSATYVVVGRPDVMTGDMLWIQPSGGPSSRIAKACVSAVAGDTIDVIGPATDANDVVALNWHRQWVLHLEITQTQRPR